MRYIIWTCESNSLVRSSQRREYYLPIVRYEGSPMFRYMIDVIAWAVAFSFLAFILAFFAE
ncbi:MAG TPA: hypothetical protein VFD20_06170, partial [Demequina sp.]|nr:hypothetical protein [Demequina sp.]